MRNPFENRPNHSGWHRMKINMEFALYTSILVMNCYCTGMVIPVVSALLTP